MTGEFAEGRSKERGHNPSPCPSPYGRGDGAARSERYSGVPSPWGEGQDEG